MCHLHRYIRLNVKDCFFQFKTARVKELRIIAVSEVKVGLCIFMIFTLETQDCNGSVDTTVLVQLPSVIGIHLVCSFFKLLPMHVFCPDVVASILSALV